MSKGTQTSKTKIVNDNLIRAKIKNMMKLQNLDYGALAECLKNLDNDNCNKNYLITKSNAQLYIEHRSLGIDFLYALSKVFGVSLDYLVSEKYDIDYTDGFDYHFSNRHYVKYMGMNYFYFCPTKSNEPMMPICGSLLINGFVEGDVILTIPAGNKQKIYKGWLIIAPETRKLFFHLRDKKGEIIQLTFNEQHINVADFSFVLGIAVSVSAGDLKRLPVAHRVCITRNPLSETGLEFVYRHLSLNSKFINIEKTKLKNLTCKMFENNGDAIFNQLANAFRAREIMSIDERYMDTISRDYELDDIQVENFIAQARSLSMGSANSKIKANLDSRIYNYLDLTGGFQD